MSQKVRITHVKVRGAAPYLGLRDGEPSYSHDPNKVMTWLCDGWRSRYNQLRSTRRKYGPGHQLTPIGGTVTDLTVKQAREQCSWLAAIPSLILESPTKLEAVEWYSNVKRRKTARRKHQRVGRMPGFKSRKRDPLRFVCWHDNGRNAVYRQANRNHGIVSITGQNPVGHRRDGARWTVEIHVKTSQPIRDYTSVNVNWTERTLVFTNAPLPLDTTPTGGMVGIDRGCVHQLALSDGSFIDLPKARLDRIGKEIRRRQRAQARKMKAAGYGNPRDYKKHGTSKRYDREQAGIRRLYRKAHDIVMDCTHKATTGIVREHDAIVLEALDITNMTRKAKAKPDPGRPGAYAHNGQSRKRGLNRSMMRAALGLVGRQLEYKARLAGRTLIEVNPAYTSQTCSKCGYCTKENRESQAVFVCKNCHARMNADTNAAVNILNRGERLLTGMDDARLTVSMSDVQTPTWCAGAMLVSEPQS
ncbi:RNA-guided endonuclease InsQ/TnpB family protein [Pseudoscardovia radai]|uniref:RNA-guided endonuclease InsQ/TnpB family protein n=1 Tax=Pseudoscardovia radai TaxID=987066 RepID=UPI003995A59E